MVKTGQAVTVEFTTCNPTTGAASDADSTPTGTLYVNGTADAASVTVTKIATGVYKAAVTLPALTAGQVVGIRISATVSTIAGEGIVWQSIAGLDYVADAVCDEALSGHTTAGTAGKALGYLTGDAYARLGAPAGASVSADILANVAKYMHGAVWIDTVNGASGTTSYVDGIPSNPCSTLASAKTIGDNLKLRRYWLQAGSSITLAAAYVGYVFDGRGYILALGGQDVSKAQIDRCEGLSGTGICTSGECVVFDSHLSTISIGEADFTRCHLNGVVTMTQASVPYLFNACVGIGATAGITFAAAGQSAVVSGFGGALTVAGMVAGNTLYIDGDADVTLAASCTGGTVYVAGGIRLTNSGSGQTVYVDSDSTSIATIKSNIDLLIKLRINKVITDPDTGLETVYDDDDTTVLKSGAIWEDKGGTVQFGGNGANRRDRMT